MFHVLIVLSECLLPFALFLVVRIMGIMEFLMEQWNECRNNYVVRILGR